MQARSLLHTIKTDYTVIHMLRTVCCAFAFIAQAHAQQALVVTVSGDIIHIAQGVQSKPQKPPFRLAGDASLRLAKGASLTVLSGGKALRIQEPAVFTPKSAQGARAAKSKGASALSKLLNRKIDTSRVGGSRHTGTLKLLRPVQGTTVRTLSEISWSPSTPAQEVSLYDNLEGEIIWQAKATGSATYTGPPLEPGPYTLIIGRAEFSIRQSTEQSSQLFAKALAEGERLQAELQREGVKDRAAILAVKTAICLIAGYDTEALELIDRAQQIAPKDRGLASLRAAIEAKVYKQ